LWGREVYVLNVNGGTVEELWRAIPARDVICPMCLYQARQPHYPNVAGLFWDTGVGGGDILRCECGYFFPIEDWFAGALDGLSVEMTREVLRGRIEAVDTHTLPGQLRSEAGGSS
jgi:hypothetical protein